MNLARRDILGDRVNRVQLFFVAVSLNAYAVFRVSIYESRATRMVWNELLKEKCAYVTSSAVNSFCRRLCFACESSPRVVFVFNGCMSRFCLTLSAVRVYDGGVKL